MPKTSMFASRKFDLPANEALRSTTMPKYYTSVSFGRLLSLAGRRLRLRVAHFDSVLGAIIDNSGLVLAPNLQQEQVRQLLSNTSGRCTGSRSSNFRKCESDGFMSKARAPLFAHTAVSMHESARRTCHSKCLLAWPRYLTSPYAFPYTRSADGRFSRTGPGSHPPACWCHVPDSARSTTSRSVGPQVRPQPLAGVHSARVVPGASRDSRTLRKHLCQRAHSFCASTPREQVPRPRGS